MKTNELVRDVLGEAPNRRSLLKKIGIAAAAVSTLKATPVGPSIFDVLNFALNLEYLEAEFYTVATSGKTIDMAPYSIPTMFAQGVGTFGMTTGGSAVSFVNNLVFSQQIAMQIAQDERDHVILLQNALQSAPGGGTSPRRLLNPAARFKAASASCG